MLLWCLLFVVCVLLVALCFVLHVSDLVSALIAFLNSVFYVSCCALLLFALCVLCVALFFVSSSGLLN